VSASVSDPAAVRSGQVWLWPVGFTLEGLIEAHASNLERLLTDDPTVRQAITAPDGHIYALPAVTAGFGVYPKLWLNRA